MAATTPPPSAGFGVELEFVGQQFYNDTIAAWTREEKKAGNEKIKGTALLVKKKPKGGGELTTLTNLDEKRWDLTAEDNSAPDERYVGFRGEIILDGTMVKVERSLREGPENKTEPIPECSATSIATSIQKFFASWAEGTPPTVPLGVENDPSPQIQIFLKDPESFKDDQGNKIGSPGFWRVRGMSGKSSNITTHVTTAMPIAHLLSPYPPEFLYAEPTKFLFFQDYKKIPGEVTPPWICTQRKLQNDTISVLEKIHSQYTIPADFLAFVTLCSIYALRGSKAKGNNGPKETFSLVPRNDFKSLYNYVNAGATLEKFTADYKSIAKIVEFNLDGEGKKWMEGSFKWVGNGEAEEYRSVGIWEWLKNLPDRDLLTAKDKEVGDSSFGKLGDKLEMVGDIAAPIWEFRGIITKLDTLHESLPKICDAFYELGQDKGRKAMEELVTTAGPNKRK